MIRLPLLVLACITSVGLSFAQPNVAAPTTSASPAAETTTTAAVGAGLKSTSQSLKAERKPKTVASAAKAPRAAAGIPQLNHVYVVEGCEACNGLQAFLRRVGVKLNVSRIDHSPYSTFPTVIYSDGTSDNGERIYSKRCQFPKNLAVEECSSGG